MTGDYQRASRTFFEAWVGEFLRAVEMFTEEQVELTFEEAAPVTPAGPAEEVFWRRLEFAGKGKGTLTLWIATPMACCRSLTKNVPDEEGKELYTELLKQSLHGAAHKLSMPGAELTLSEEGLADSEPHEAMPFFRVRISLRGSLLGVLELGLDSAFTAYLVNPPKAAVEAPAVQEATPPPAPPLSGSGVYRRLLELDLPLAVVLGRATLPINDVLNLTAGSLVELDRKAGDLVEIVVHNSVIARGEVVAIKGNYGVRIREVISRNDRVMLQQEMCGTAQCSREVN